MTTKDKKPSAGKKRSTVVVAPDRGTRARGTNQAFARAQSVRARQKELIANSPRHTRAKWVIILVIIALLACLGIWTTRLYYQAKNNLQTTTVLADKIKQIYSTDYQDSAQKKIDKKKKAKAYSPDRMLLMDNPYGTNTMSLYAYFTTSSPAAVTYSISTPDDKSYPTFTRAVHQNQSYQTSHEFSIIGLIPATKNLITFTISYEDGHRETHTYTQIMGNLWGTEPSRLSTTVTRRMTAESKSLSGQLDQGLYFVSGTGVNARNYTYLYDSSGVLRAELPMSNNHGTSLKIRHGLLYFVSDYTQVCAMNNLGKLVSISTTPSTYQINNDFDFDNQGNILVIASDKSQADTNNLILKINPVTGVSREYINFSTLLKDYRKNARSYSLSDGSSKNSTSASENLWSWLELNSIQYIPGESLLVSSRETSTIMKISLGKGQKDNSAHLLYLLGPHQIWDTTTYADFVYSRDGSFSSHAGQHSVFQMDDGWAKAWISNQNTSAASADKKIKSLSNSDHLVGMFNNNYGYSPTIPDLDWAETVPGVSTASKGNFSKYRSYFTLYRVSEKAKTYSQIMRFSVPYSPLYSNAQIITLNTAQRASSNTGTVSSTVSDSSGPLVILMNSAQQKTWGLYDSRGRLLQRFTAGGDIKMTGEVTFFTGNNFYFDLHEG